MGSTQLTAIGVAAFTALASFGIPAQEPTFGARVDVVAVDVNVVDNDGRPVQGLKEGDFVLSVDGNPRRVTSVSFVQDAPLPAGKMPEAAPATGGATALFSSNEGSQSGRLILLLIDEDNIRSGGGRAAIESARQFVDRLQPADRVGVLAFPTGPRVEMSADHDAVRAALGRIVGHDSPINLGKNLGLSEAFGIDSGQGDLLTRVADRECIGETGRARQACEEQIEVAAHTLAAAARQRSRASLDAIRTILAGLRRIEGPKTVVLVSEALVAGADTGDISEFTLKLQDIARECTSARVTVFALRLERPLVDMATGPAPPTATLDEQLQAEGLRSLAAAARGALINVVGSGQSAFDRIARELSAHYLLGFETQAADRDGRPHRIEVRTTRRGVQVRSRREFVFAAAAGETDEGALARVLSSPFLATDIPLRLTTYAMRHPENSKIRLVLSADIGRNIAAPQQMSIGFVVFDGRGKVVSNALQRMLLAPDRVPGSVPYVVSATVEPGEYTVRLAVRDAAGGTGSVERKATARLTEIPPMQMSDLLLADEDPSQPGKWQPSVGGRASGEMSGYLEVYSSDRQALGKATCRLEVAADETAPALVTGEARPAGPPEKGRRAVTARVGLDLLPPGTYIARALVMLDGRTLGRVARPFVVAPGGDQHAARRPTAPFADLVRPFDVRQVLDPGVLAPFLDRLAAPGVVPASASVQAAIAQAKRGAFDTSFDKLSSGRDLAATFLHGLALLSRNDLERAAGDFRQTLQLSSDFFPAAFYLGACYAAGGRGREAVGAWQTTLAGESNLEVAYLMSFDALARLGDWRQALDVARDGLSQWPSDPALQRRAAAASVMTGADAEALKVLRAYLARSTGDQDALFLAMSLLVRPRLAGIGDDEGTDVEEFERYAHQYAKANGPQQPLVALWEKYLKGQ